MPYRHSLRVLIPLLLLLLAASLPAAALVYDPTVCADHQPGDTYSEECLEMMAAYPEPIVFEITPDYMTLGQYSFWRVGPGAVTRYDAPGGSPVSEIAAGFNYVRATDTSVEGWLQIEGGLWITRDIATYAEASQLKGVRLLNGLQHPFAWVLDTTGLYTSAYPGGPQDVENGRLLFRYDRINIFAEVYDEEGWRWYMVGPNQWIKQIFVSKAIRVERPEGVEGRWISVDLYEQNLVAYDGDVPVFATLISTGVPPTETNEGVFEVWARLDRDGMSSATGAPRAYALQSVPWVMYFDDSISLHGTYWHDLFGYRTSRGCVNLSISDARFVYDWTAAGADENGDILTYVYVHSSGEYRSGTVGG